MSTVACPEAVALLLLRAVPLPAASAAASFSKNVLQENLLNEFFGDSAAEDSRQGRAGQRKKEQLEATIRPRPTCNCSASVDRHMPGQASVDFYKLSESLLRLHDVTLSYSACLPASCVDKDKTSAAI